MAASLTGALTQFLLDAEEEVVGRAERVRASTLSDLERQRANVESLMGLFAARLQRQEVGLSALQEEFGRASARLSQCAESIRALSDQQAQQAALLGQIRDVLRVLATPVENPADSPRNPV